ncbi:MAG: helix-hairpin-helix domain-containing protein [Candidatus Nanopelagicales bacterium]
MTDWPKGVGAPAARALSAAGFTDLTDLAAATERDLAGLHGMGPKALGILKAALAERGLALADHAQRRSGPLPH